MGKLNKDTIANHLSQMIQINTVTNQDLSEFYKFHTLLEELYPTIYEKGEKILIDGSLLIKIEGKNKNLAPMLIMSHTDVVEAEGTWTYPPFSGKIENNIIWGRGTIDTKGSLCAFFEATEDLLKDGFIPEFDLYLASSIDEEIMGVGAKKTVDYLEKNGVKLGVVLDEGGAIVEAPMPGLSGYYAMLGVMEKGYANIEFIATSNGGHSSTPTNDTPIARLSAFINEVNTKSPFKKEITSPIKNMFITMSQTMSQPYKFLFNNIEVFSPILKNVLPKLSPQANAMLTTTCAFTMSSGSPAANIIPEKASVVANMRFMIHQPMKKSLEIIKNVANKHDVEMNVLYAHDCSKITDVNDKNYKYVCRCIHDVFEDVKPTPYIMLGGTDSRHYTRICDSVIRFSPLKITNQQLHSVHAIDENISVDSLYDAVKFYKYFMKNYKG